MSLHVDIVSMCHDLGVPAMCAEGWQVCAVRGFRRPAFGLCSLGRFYAVLVEMTAVSVTKGPVSVTNGPVSVKKRTCQC